MDWIQAHRKRLLIVLLTILAISGALGVRNTLRHETAKKAAGALYEARKLGAESPAGIAALEKVAKDFAGTSAAWESLMLLARYEQADSAATEAREKLFARYARAFALEREAKSADALASIESAQKLGLPHLKAELALTRARLLDKLGKRDEAVKIYDAVAKEFANSDAGRTAENWKSL